MAYQAPVRDQLFVLREVLGLEHYANLPGFADAPMDVVEQILTEGAKFCEEVLAPLNHVGDKEGCVWSPDNTVKTPNRLQGRLARHGRGRLARARAPRPSTAARACRGSWAWPIPRCRRRPTWPSPCTRA